MGYSLGDFSNQLSQGGISQPMPQIQQPMPMPVQQAPQQQVQGISAPQGLVNNHDITNPDHLGNISAATQEAAQTYAKQAQSSKDKADKAKLIGGILNMVGGLATASNNIYQQSKRQRPINIGAPLSVIGSGVDALGEHYTNDSQENAQKAGIYQLPGMTSQLGKSLAYSVDSGTKNVPFDAFKEINQPVNMDTLYVNGQMTPAQKSAYEQLQYLKRPPNVSSTIFVDSKGNPLNVSANNRTGATRVSPINLPSGSLKVGTQNTKQDEKQIEYQKTGTGLLKSLDDLETTMSTIPSGPVEGRVGNLLSGYGLGKNKEAITKFNSLVQGLAFQYGKDFSGRYNNTEGEQIKNNLLPILSLPASQQAAALQSARQLVRNKFGVAQDQSQATSQNNGPLPQSPSPQMPQGATHIAPGSDGKNYYVDSKGNILGSAQ